MTIDLIKNEVITAININDKMPHQIKYKKLLGVTMVAMALTLSACDRKDESTMEGSALEIDSQTSETEAAAEVAAASAPMIVDREDSPVVPSQDRPDNTGAVAEGGDLVNEDMSNDDIGTGDIDSIEVTDGIEEESTATY